jgi:hypothetical protein
MTDIKDMATYNKYEDYTYKKTVLSPRRLCETRSGNLAHAVGRIAFRPGRPMLVEHVGGLYLEHDLLGGVVTPGYGDEYSIIHVFEEEQLQPPLRVACG